MRLALAAVAFVAACTFPVGSSVAPTPWPAQAAAWALRGACDDCASIPVYASSDVGEAGASMRWHWGLPSVTYAAPWLDALEARYGHTVAVWVFAHEFGHRIDGWAPEGSWGRELVADAWAGCALARLGMPIEATEAALHEAISPTPTPTHPAYAARIEATRHGARVCAR